MNQDNNLPLCMVCSPIGGAGNHLRWLLLLDSRYHINVNKSTISTTDEKLNFIDNIIYPDNRTWNNWLAIELTYRSHINQYLKFSHNYSDFYDGLKTIGLITDPDLAFKHYFKFNPMLNLNSKSTFIKQIDKENWIAKILDREFEHFRAVDGSRLFSSRLDKDFYCSIIEFLELEDHYNDAQKIHSKWFNLNTKAEIDIINDLTNVYQRT